MGAALPEYADRLDLLHEGLRGEFAQIVGQLPGLEGSRVIDVGCGDGFFTELLVAADAETVWAVDSDAAFLGAAGERLRDRVASGQVRLLKCDARRLAFDDASVDVIWSAHSMQSYDQIPDILAEFRRVLRPGGVLAILESDSIHSVMLPWPPRLELAVREAERASLADADDRMGAYFPRYAARLIAEAGFRDFTARPTLIHRPGPLDERLRQYALLYLRDLVARVGNQLDPSLAAMAGAFAESYETPGGELSMTSLQMLMTAVRGRDVGDR
jgi:ubiquinone/menaquinone biosynthesis C-methylase UbiE